MLFNMRRILVFTTALLLAGCVSRAPEVPQVQAPAPVQKKELTTDLLGATAGELIQAFGQPALQVREGAGLKLQWRGRACVMDAYLYPSGSSGTLKVTHVDTRTPTGADFDQAACIFSLRERAI